MIALARHSSRLKHIRGENLIDRIISGHRDFSGTILTQFNFAADPERFALLYNYLSRQDFSREKNRLDFQNCYWKDVNLTQHVYDLVLKQEIELGLPLQSLQAQRAGFIEVCFRYTDLHNANFSDAKLENCDFTGAGKQYARFTHTTVITLQGAEDLYSKREIDREHSEPKVRAYPQI